LLLKRQGLEKKIFPFLVTLGVKKVQMVFAKSFHQKGLQVKSSKSFQVQIPSKSFQKFQKVSKFYKSSKISKS